MDTVLETKKQPNLLKKYWYVIAIIAVLIVVVMVKSSIGSASFMVARQDLRIDAVKQGDFEVTVRSNGVLSAKVTHSVVSQVTGRVEALFVKPGDVVEVGTVLVRLSNPELYEDEDKLSWSYKLIEAETTSAFKLSESGLLDQEGVLVSAKLAHKASTMKLAAETDLRKQDRSSISELDYQRSKFDVEERKSRWEIEQKRLVKMQENLKLLAKVHTAQKENIKNDIERLKRQIGSLEVKATSSGVVQKIDLELGQQLDTGEEAARVADNSQLIAELKVQELQVLNIAIGQTVSINTRQNKIEGKVLRIAPTVDSGMVQVDVELTGDMPAEARPDLTIEGSIKVAQIGQTLFVNRPAYAQRDSSIGIYLLSQDGSNAKRIPVKLGQTTASKVQVLDGLKQGDRIIVSDTSSFEQHDEVLIN